ncbi:MAG: protein kinase, partial [Bdellovibrionales bacterium]|nr:protein kinase [Bdellovibrionales bacterium]
MPPGAPSWNYARLSRYYGLEHLKDFLLIPEYKRPLAHEPGTEYFGEKGVYQVYDNIWIGNGATSIVRLARSDTGLCAVKFASPGLGETLLTQEASNLSTLSYHPNIVSLRDVIVEGSRTRAIVLELVSGVSLSDIVNRFRTCTPSKDQQTGRSLSENKGSREEVDQNLPSNLAPQMSLLYAELILYSVGILARAVKHVAAEGMVHCDVRPLNFIVSRDIESSKLIDFNISAKANQTFNFRLGNPDFAPREQIAGGTVTEMWDVYSLGRTLATAFQSSNEISFTQYNESASRLPRELHGFGLGELITDATKRVGGGMTSGE